MSLRQSLTHEAGVGVFSTAKMPADMLVAGANVFDGLITCLNCISIEYFGDLVDSTTVREDSPFLYWFEKSTKSTSTHWIDGASSFGIAPVLNHSTAPNCVARFERVRD